MNWIEINKKRLVRKFALISTSHYEFGEFKNFHIIVEGLSEQQLLLMQEGFDEYNRLWEECYAKERENAYNRITEDLRTPLENHAKNTHFGDFNMKICQKLWSEKDLVIEHFVTEDLVS